MLIIIDAIDQRNETENVEKNGANHEIRTDYDSLVSNPIVSPSISTLLSIIQNAF